MLGVAGLGEANCGVASGWFLLIFCFIPLFFLSPSLHHDLLLKELYQARSLHGKKKAPRASFFSICSADSCFFFAFRSPKSRDRSDCTLKAVYYSQMSDFKISSLLLFPLAHVVEGVGSKQFKSLVAKDESR